MSLLNSLLVVGAIVATPALATDHAVEAHVFSYPSPGAVHLEIIVRDLVEKAVAKCGAEAKVLGLTGIDLKVRGGVNDLVAELDGEGTLDFWYPKIDAKATVRCAD